MSEETTATTTASAAAGSGSSGDGSEYRFVLPEVRDRPAFLAVFEGDDAFCATRTKMRDDVIASLRSLAPLAERVRAQSFLDRLTESVFGSGPSPACAESFESFGEALPVYVTGVASSLHSTVVARGVKISQKETANILLDWVLQPFFSKFAFFLLFFLHALQSRLHWHNTAACS